MKQLGYLVGTIKYLILRMNKESHLGLGRFEIPENRHPLVIFLDESNPLSNFCGGGVLS
jgi:hypothetical protein